MPDDEKDLHLRPGEGPKVEPVIDGWWTLPPEEREKLKAEMVEAERIRDARSAAAPQASPSPHEGQVEREPGRLIVDRAALVGCLARMKRAVRKGLGKATWKLQPDALVLQWSGVTEELPARGQARVTATLESNVMANLGRAIPKTAEVTVRVDGDRLSLGSFSVACAIEAEEPPDLLPTNPSALDLLLLGYSRSPEDIDRAGLHGEMTRLRERLDLTVDTVAKSLGWLHIPRKVVAGWIDAHLRAVAKGEPTFEIGVKKVVADQKGQIALFDEYRGRRE